MEKAAQAAVGGRLQDAQSSLSDVLAASGLGGSQASSKMRLHTLLSGAEGAPFFRLGTAHRAPHGQYLSH
jgi:hypothetical protein